jgi:drug/metabolite transporter (DMT)-like permease
VLGVLLALGSSIIWGCADFVGGLQSRRWPVLTVLIWAQVVAVVACVVFVLVAGDGLPDGHAIAWATAASVCGSAALACFYRGLSIGTMSIVAPISATGAILPVLYGVFSGERPGALQVAGIAVALVGIVLAAREKGDERSGDEGRIDKEVARTALGLALVAAVGFGVFMLGLERATSTAGVAWSLLLIRGVTVVMLVSVALVVRPPLRIGVRAVGPLAFVGAGDLTANAMFATATTMGLLSVVAVLGSLYPAMTVILARIVLKEKVSRMQEAGVLAVLAGVVAISAG